MDTLAVFRSRSDALKIYNFLKKHKIACATVNTPARLGLGCGISVVFPSSQSETLKKAISSLGINSFVGLFRR